MRKPATLDAAVDVVRKSRLVNEDRLTAYLDELRRDWPVDPDPDQLFTDLIQLGLLTSFQAKQLGNGRWKGFEIGNYRILERLGQGGMGHVYLAEHKALGKRVALKVLSRHSVSPLAVERFLREARAAAKLDHPHIIRVFDIEPENDPPFIVMEYADGVTLQAAVAKTGTFSPAATAWIGRQIALALEAAFRHGLVHRDVKPANVLVDRTGDARLLDLGIVRIEGEHITSEYNANTILGTIDYLAPEQAIDSSQVDTRADIYSLGATLYFLLVGHTPLAAGSVRERLHQLQTVSPPNIRVLRPDVPEGLAAALHRAMEKLPALRFATPVAFADALEPFAKREAPFPANLFRQANSTLSDVQGAPTPEGGLPLPLTEEMDAPTDEQAIEPVAIRPLAENPAPVRSRVWMLWLGIALLLGLLAIAFYKSP